MGATIKSVQSGTTSLDGLTSANVALTAVDTSRSFVMLTVDCADTRANRQFVLGDITSATNLNLSRSNSAAGLCDVHWMVVEFTNGVTVQRVAPGAQSAVASVDATISAVDLTRTFVVGSHLTTEGTSGGGGGLNHRLILRFINATTLRLARNASVNSFTPIAYVVEFT